MMGFFAPAHRPVDYNPQAVRQKEEPIMPDRIHVDEDRGIIEVKSHGLVSTEDIAESIRKVRQILNEKKSTGFS